MDRFLDCLCENRLESLIIDGKPGQEELQEAWVLILTEYYEMKGDAGGESEYWTLSEEIRKVQQHLFLLNVSLDLLWNRYSDNIAESVRRLGYSFKPVDKDPKAYRHLLISIQNKAGKKKIQLSQLCTELMSKVNEISKQENPKREDFETMLVYLEEMQKTSYDFTTMPVQKYIQLEKKYWKTIDLLEAKKQK